MARSARKEAYSRRHRYDAPGSFGPILRHGRKLRGRYVVVNVATGRSAESRLGLALTRRGIPRAVDRNRLRRIAREAFRRHRLKHAGLDCVIALRGAYDEMNAQAIADELRGLFNQLVQDAGA